LINRFSADQVAIVRGTHRIAVLGQAADRAQTGAERGTDNDQGDQHFEQGKPWRRAGQVCGWISHRNDEVKTA